jgi:hypothetical protein
MELTLRQQMMLDERLVEDTGRLTVTSYASCNACGERSTGDQDSRVDDQRSRLMMDLSG